MTKLTPTYAVESFGGEHRIGFADIFHALKWMRRNGRRGDRLRNLRTGRILAKHPGGSPARSAYGFLKDVETENGNGKLHELSKAANASRSA